MEKHRLYFGEQRSIGLLKSGCEKHVKALQSKDVKQLGMSGKQRCYHGSIDEMFEAMQLEHFESLWRHKT